jgi:hypothetical protein
MPIRFPTIKKSKIALIYLRVGGMSNIIGKLSTRLITLPQISPQWEACTEIMNLQSCENPNFGNFKTPNLGISRENDIWMSPCD